MIFALTFALKFQAVYGFWKESLWIVKSYNPFRVNPFLSPWEAIEGALVDPISLVITAGFGGLALIVILGFLLLQHRGKTSSSGDNSYSSTYETRDYYRQYGPKKTQEPKHSYDGGHKPFRSDAEIEANARKVKANARAIMIVIIVVALAAVIIAGLFDLTNLILLIFLIPIALSFLWSRRNRSASDDRENRN